MYKLITYIFRTPSPSFFSIEEVFSTVIPEVAKHLPVSRLELPYPSGFWGVLRNLATFRKEKNTLYHITGQEYYLALRTGRDTVLTIHDVGSAFTGKWLRDLMIRLFWFRIPARLARRITVISEFSKGELVKLVPFAAHKIRVIHNPLNPALEYQPKPFNTERPVILLMGTKPNKNLERIFPALKDIPCRLIIVGKLSDDQLTILNKHGFVSESDPLFPSPLPAQLRHSGGHHAGGPEGIECSAVPELKSPLGPDLSEVGVNSEIGNPKSAIQIIRNTFSNYHNLPYKEILALYRECDLLCFASTYEGFGLPIPEAQATGRPVITSTVASMPEVAGEGACLVDPFSVESIRKGVLRIIRDSAFREELVQKGLRNIERFSREKIAADYLMVYMDLSKE